jgi:hypothetical protein
MPYSHWLVQHVPLVGTRLDVLNIDVGDDVVAKQPPDLLDVAVHDLVTVNDLNGVILYKHKTM